MASSSFGQSGHGMSGIAPTPFPAIDSCSMNATRHFGVRSVCAQCRGPASLRNPGKTLALPYSFYRTLSGCYPAAASPSFERGRSPLAADGDHGRCEPTSLGLLACIEPSKATYCAGHARYGRRGYTFGKHVPAQAHWGRAYASISPCRHRNSIFDGCANQPFRRRTLRIAVATYRYCITSYNGK